MNFYAKITVTTGNNRFFSDLVRTDKGKLSVVNERCGKVDTKLFWRWRKFHEKMGIRIS